jgi:membrane protease YdiL (CAAX protease family)
MEIDLPPVPPEAGAVVGPAAGVLIAGASIASLWAIGGVVARLRRGEPAVPPRPHAPVPWAGFDVATVVYLSICCQFLSSALLPSPATMADKLAGGVLGMATATSLAAAWLLYRQAPAYALGFGLGSLAADLRLAAAALALILAPLLAVAGILDRLVPYEHPIIDFLARHRDLPSLMLVGVAAVIVAPVAEEFFFRRVLQGWLEKAWGAIPAVGISAVLFGLAHVGQGLAWVPLVVFGAVAGYLARQTGSIVPGIALHALFNAASLALVLWQTAPAVDR